MKIKFWKKEDEDESSQSSFNDDLTKDFGGPSLPEASIQQAPERDIVPKFDEYSGVSKPNFQEPARTYSKDDLIEAKIEAVKSKIEIIDHKLDLVISKLKDAY